MEQRGRGLARGRDENRDVAEHAVVERVGEA
jgi:hypothetical protein